VLIRAVFAATLGFGLLAAPLVADAQQAGKLYRIGYLSVSQAEFDQSWVSAFRDGLRKVGYVEGQDLVIEQRHAAGHSERLPELAAELLRLKIDVLVVEGPRPDDPAVGPAASGSGHRMTGSRAADQVTSLRPLAPARGSREADV
jgi:ABC-type sugar transport system substrate-binding protein